MHKSCLFSLLGKWGHYLPYLTKLLSHCWWFLKNYLRCCYDHMCLVPWAWERIFFFQSLLIIVLLPGFSNCEAGMQPQQGECQREPSCLFYVFHLVSMSLSWSCSRCKTVLFCLHHLCKPQLILGFGVVLKSHSFSCIYSFFLLRWQDKVDFCISFAFLYHPSCMKEL